MAHPCRLLLASRFADNDAFPGLTMSSLRAIVVAAGSGARIGGNVPKQYRPLLGQPLLRHSIAALCGNPRISQIAVALAKGDDWFERFDWSVFAPKLLPLRCGGETRAQTVQNALHALSSRERENGDDWILVHDAARPCLSSDDLNHLITELEDDDVGGLLATPVADTLKRSDATGRASATESRDGLWQAQTPQMFRYALLTQALSHADAGITDEAGAVERLGLKPRLVAGSSMNLKVTYAQDFALAEAILASRNKDKK